MSEKEYSKFLKNLPFGKKYLMPREKLTALYDQRYSPIKERVEARLARKEKVTRLPSLEDEEKVKRKEIVVSPKEEKTEILEGVGGPPASLSSELN